jgi:hypothetical protein
VGPRGDDGPAEPLGTRGDQPLARRPGVDDLECEPVRSNARSRCGYALHLRGSRVAEPEGIRGEWHVFAVTGVDGVTRQPPLELQSRPIFASDQAASRRNAVRARDVSQRNPDEHPGAREHHVRLRLVVEVGDPAYDGTSVSAAGLDLERALGES